MEAIKYYDLGIRANLVDKGSYIVIRIVHCWADSPILINSRRIFDDEILEFGIRFGTEDEAKIFQKTKFYKAVFNQCIKSNL